MLIRMRFLSINDKKQGLSEYFAKNSHFKECVIHIKIAIMLEFLTTISYSLELLNEVTHDVVLTGDVKLVS